ncbi:hypothetical protein CONPUDRAFT_160131 [Coniophora puteana RWD-64-598 SS2]|uniref:Uncharacterized protein n=1 Tax=Coniophora puteana (strain RWD-64-598) TaxID=741705 RepID=R7SE30_CONPW|nr:uncharacterized protein CONPUDRAFT_160131 [Coniophora puteana RWD-64-598 SS2]EIW74428.1 hypothetical protein CONPUDRAFT_160131 [Coniophora puteana RWD-64-598 SS2]
MSSAAVRTRAPSLGLTPSKRLLIKHRHHSLSLPLISEASDNLEARDPLEGLRTKFVGDINLPESEEPLLKESKRRFVLFPIHSDLADVQEAEASFWAAEEMDLSKDLHDWNNRPNKNQRHFISHVLAFFAASDGIVNENLSSAFLMRFRLLRLDASTVSIHSETYSLLIDTYIKDPAQREYLLTPSK